MPNRNPQGGVHAYLVNQGRVWVESINCTLNTAIIRFDPGEGLRSKSKKVKLTDIDFNREWKFR